MIIKRKVYSTIILFFFSLLCHSVALANQGEAPVNKVRKSPLLILGDSASPPYEFINKEGNPDGFNVELITAIMANLNLKYEIRLNEWSNAVEQVRNGDADVLLGILPTKQYEEFFNFSTPTTFVDYKIVHRQDSKIKNLDDLKNKDIIIIDGKIIRSLFDNSVIPGNQVIVDKMRDGLKMLSAGQYDAAICDNDVATYNINNLGLYNLEVKSFNLPTIDMCIAVAKKDTALMSSIEKSIKLLKESGKYEAIYAKWFGVKDETFISAKAYIIIGVIISILIVVLIFFILLRLKIRIVTKFLNQSYANESLQLKKLNTIISTLPIGFAICDKNGIVKYLNRSLIEICGIKDEARFLDQKVSIFNDPILDKSYHKRIKCGEELDFSMEYDLSKIKDTGHFDTIFSHKIMVDVNIRTIKDANGEIMDIIIIMQNLTEFSKQQDLLKKFKQNLSLAADAGNLKVWEYDFDNNVVIPIYGKLNSNSIQPFEAFRAMIHPDDNIKHTEAIKSLFKNKTGKASCQVRVWNDAKGYFEYTEIEMIARLSPDNKISGIVGTSRMVAHEYLLINNYNRIIETLKLVVDKSKISVWLFNIEDQKFSILQDGVFRNTNITFSNLLIHIHPDDTESFHSTMLMLVDGDKECDLIEYRIKYFTQSHYVTIRCNIKSITESDGKIVSLIASCEEVQ